MIFTFSFPVTFTFDLLISNLIFQFTHSKWIGFQFLISNKLLVPSQKPRSPWHHYLIIDHLFHF